MNNDPNEEVKTEEIFEKLAADDWLQNRSVIGLKNVVPTAAREYAIMHPKDMITAIDTVTKAIVSATKDRSSMSRVKWSLHWEKVFLEFSQWSHLFNKELRARIKETDGVDKDELTKDLNRKYSYVYSYWWNRMHYISTVLSSKSRLAGSSVVKGIERGRKTLIRLISDEVLFNELHEEFKKLINWHQSFSSDEALKPIIDSNRNK